MWPREMKGYDAFTRSDKAMACRTRDILVERFPKCFASRTGQKRPLKIGIGCDLVLAIPEVGARAIGLALLDYTWGQKYCSCLVAGALRYDLDGAEHGLVSDIEAEHALKRLQHFETTNRQRAHEAMRAASSAVQKVG